MTSPRPPTGIRSRRRRATARSIAILLLILAALALYCRHLGYPAGPIYRLVPATPGSTHQDGTVAVLMSGDMGFNTGMGPRIAEELSKGGIAVLGVNSLTAFAHRRTQQETAALTSDAIIRALKIPGARRVVLIGQSFGANVLLAGISGLPASLRAKVPLVELVVPGTTMLFRATPSGIFEFGNDGPALPIARQVDWVPVLCIFGETERGSLCPEWHQQNVTRVALPGGHFLDHDAALVAATLLRHIRTRVQHGP